MACVLKLVRLDDFTLDIDSVDLMAGGYELAKDGYQPTAAPDGVKSVFESITLKITGTSKDDLASKVQEIDEKIKQVGWWLKDPGVEKYQVWLRAQLSNESLPRQAQIISIKPPERIPLYNPLEIGSNYIGEYTLGIERAPFWEGSITSPVSKTDINALGGTQALSAAVSGDVPARLVRLRIYPKSGSSNVSAAWLGWKTSRFGDAANFVGNWPLNNSLYGLDTSEVADATAYTGYRVVTTFSGDATLKMRTEVAVSNVSVNTEDQRGTYLVLMRAKMSDTSIARARIAGSFGLAFPVYRSRQIISGTSWQLYEMGVIKIPPSRVYSSYHSISGFMIEVDAERISGSGELHMDCLCMIPIDDGAIKVTLPSSLSSAVNQKVAIFQAADNHIFSWFETNVSSIYYAALVSPQNEWGLPNDATAPVAVCAASDPAGSGSTNGAKVNFEYTYVSRWRTLRGNIT